jgi:DNA mismatch repair ATPase MutL
MEDISLHILDIVENSITAGASKIEIKIVEDIKANLLSVEIKDNGKGMDEEMLRRACDPFFTTKTTKKVGLGIPMLAQSAKESMGDIKITSKKGEGTTVYARFQYDHIDRKPLGNIAESIIVLIVSNPDIDFLFQHIKNGKTYILDTAKIKKELENVPINAPEVIKIIKDDINTWLNNKNNVIK